MDIELLATYDAFLSAEKVWNELLARSYSDHVSMTFEWVRSWWQGFGAGRKMLVLLLKENGRCVGIAPLMISRTRYRGFPVKELGFIQNEHTPRADFILTTPPGPALRAVLDWLKQREKWDILHLANIPRESPTVPALAALFREHGRLFGVKDGLHSPFIPVDSDWDSFYQSRTKKFRKVLRNKVNRIERLGNCEIGCYGSGDQAAGVFEKIAAISKNSWKSKYRQEISGNGATRRFFEELSRTAAENRWLNVWLMTIGGRPVAYEYHLNYKGRVSALRADYDENFRESSPGSVLDLHIVRHLFEQGVKEYDLCGTTDFYKMNWTSNVRRHERFLLYAPTLYGRLLHFVEFGLIEQMKKHAAVRKAREFLRPSTAKKEYVNEHP